MAKSLKLSPFKREKPPRVINICGHKIKVRVVDHLEDSGSELLGAWNADKKTIFLAKHENWRSCLFHESLHAALYLTGAVEGLTASKEESIVLALEHAIFPLI